MTDTPVSTASEDVDTSAEAIGRSITELISWLTGPDSGQNDGLVTAANQLAALAAERDALAARMALLDTQAACATIMQQQRDAARAEAARLREALTAACSALGEEILGRYGMSNGQIALHPVEQRRFQRDMAEVDVYRAALAQKEG